MTRAAAVALALAMLLGWALLAARSFDRAFQEGRFFVRTERCPLLEWRRGELVELCPIGWGQEEP